jgi:hypothetical protein
MRRRHGAQAGGRRGRGNAPAGLPLRTSPTALKGGACCGKKVGTVYSLCRFLRVHEQECEKNLEGGQEEGPSSCKEQGGAGVSYPSFVILITTTKHSRKG